MQTDISVDGNYISGTLHKLTSGQLVTDWGEGYFVALKFDDIPDGAAVKVGLAPSQGAGFVPLDEDRDGVFKVTDKNTQTLKVITTRNERTQTDTYYLSNLTLD